MGTWDGADSVNGAGAFHENDIEHIKPNLTRRMEALIERMAANDDTHPHYAEARAIMAELKPVDGDLIEARMIAVDRLNSLGASSEQIAAGEIANGERDDTIVVHVALAAIRRGRALERETLAAGGTAHE